MYKIEHFCTDPENLFRVILDAPSISEQVFYGTKEECEFYVNYIQNERMAGHIKVIRKYAHNMKELKLWID